LYVYGTTLLHLRTPTDRYYVVLVKIKQRSTYKHTNRSLLVSVLESTEAIRAVSLSAWAYAVTWPISNYHWRCTTPPIL